MKTLILFLLSIIGITAKAQVLVPHPELHQREFNYQLEKDKSLKSYTSFFLEKSKHKSFEISESFARAKTAELSGGFEAAKKHYREVHQKAVTSIALSPPLISIVTKSLEALQRLATGQAEKEFWNKEETQFLILLKSRGEPTEKVFPTEAVIEWHPFSQFAHGSLIVINGISFTLKPTLKINLLPGRFHVTVVSNTHQPEKLSAQRDSLLVWKPLPRPFLEGLCHSPLLSGEWPSDVSVSGLYSKGCLKELTGSNAYLARVPRHELGEISLPQSIIEKKSLASSPLFWGATAVLTGVILHSYLKDKRVEIEMPRWR